jgi:hypothetical protein
LAVREKDTGLVPKRQHFRILFLVVGGACQVGCICYRSWFREQLTSGKMRKETSAGPRRKKNQILAFQNRNRSSLIYRKKKKERIVIMIKEGATNNRKQQR